MKIVYFLCLALIVSTLGCTVKQEYHFNRDMSGKTVSTIDMSLVNAFINPEDAESSELNTTFDTLDVFMDNAVNDLKLIEGLSNINWSWNDEKNVIFLTYNFKNLESLNQSLSTNNYSYLTSSDNRMTPKFTKKGRKLIYEIPEIKMDTVFNDEKTKEMRSFFKYELSFIFDKPVRKLKNKNATLSDDKTKVILETSMFDLFDENFDRRFIIKL